MSNNQLHRITIEPGKCGGRPCIRDYRMRVSDVLDLLAAGMSERDILNDYPFLEAEDIQACLQYASAQSRHIQHLCRSREAAYRIGTIDRNLKQAQRLQTPLLWECLENSEIRNFEDLFRIPCLGLRIFPTLRFRFSLLG